MENYCFKYSFFGVIKLLYKIVLLKPWLFLDEKVVSFDEDNLVCLELAVDGEFYSVIFFVIKIEILFLLIVVGLRTGIF